MTITVTITVTRLCSLLSARIIPPEGGATEFASARGAYPSLPEALKRRVERATVVHDFSWSRDQVRPGFFTDKERAEYPPVRHPGVVPRGARLAHRGDAGGAGAGACCTGRRRSTPRATSG